jgi:hypothetical protein
MRGMFALVLAFTTALAGCADAGRSTFSPLGPSPVAPATPATPAAPVAAREYATRPTCTTTHLVPATQPRGMREVSTRVGGDVPATNSGPTMGPTNAFGVWSVDIEWQDPASSVTLWVVSVGGMPPITGVRTGPTTASACWDAPTKDDGYRVQLAESGRADAQDVRVTYYFPTASLCGPVACAAPAPPGR